MGLVSDHIIEKLLFKQVERPKDFCGIKIVNTHGDIYRINVYHEFFDEDLQLDTRRMHSSYSCLYKNNKLTIRDL